MDWGNVRLANLVDYLQSIQSITASNIPSGAETVQTALRCLPWKRLEGGGPVPYPFRSPPDLTTLARRHGGKFPEAYVSNVLRNGVVMPSHGPAEMSILGSGFCGGPNGRASSRSSDHKPDNYIKSFQQK